MKVVLLSRRNSRVTADLVTGVPQSERIACVWHRQAKNNYLGQHAGMPVWGSTAYAGRWMNAYWKQTSTNHNHQGRQASPWPLADVPFVRWTVVRTQCGKASSGATNYFAGSEDKSLTAGTTHHATVGCGFQLRKTKKNVIKTKRVRGQKKIVFGYGTSAMSLRQQAWLGWKPWQILLAQCQFMCSILCPDKGVEQEQAR